MKKIGIIAQFNLKNVNYGNRLQAYALNFYLRKTYPQFDIETLYFDFYDVNLETKKENIFCDGIIMKKSKSLFSKLSYRFVMKNILHKRLCNCNNFSENNMKIPNNPLTWEQLVNCSYDIFIVGSKVCII